MLLRKATGNMYDFLTHIWNPVKGKCGYDCSYCYMRKMERFPHIARINRGETYLDEKEMRTNLGEGNYIFVCSSCDLFHDDIPGEWIRRIMEYANSSYNRFLWHTKNPRRALEFQECFSNTDMLCVTVETNREYPEISKAPSPLSRFHAIGDWGKPWMLTMEPILDFNLEDLAVYLGRNVPVQVNIGADSGRNNLPEPSPEKLKELIGWLESKGVAVHQKKNLGRLLPEHRPCGGKGGR